MNPVALLVFLFSLWSAPASGQDDILSWFVRVNSAAQNPQQPRTFRLFKEVDTVPLQLVMENESVRRIVISPDLFGLSKWVTVSDVRDGRSLDTVIEWTACTAGQTVTALPAHSADRVTVNSGRAVTCEALLRRADGTPFKWGTYKVEFSLESVRQSLQEAHGGQWSGRFLPRTEMTLVLHAAVEKTEIAEQHLLAGGAAMDANRVDEAIAEYREGLAARPEDTPLLVGLGGAYLQTGRYREAATVYEQLVPALQGKHSAIFEYLAYAYVGMGDERRAAEVLARGGVSQERITDALVRYRELVARRSGQTSR